MAFDSRVTVTNIDYLTLLEIARGGPEPPAVTYDFGRKVFLSNFQDEGIYGKPVSISNGVTTHLPDPDLVSTNP